MKSEDSGWPDRGVLPYFLLPITLTAVICFAMFASPWPNTAVISFASTSSHLTSNATANDLYHYLFSAASLLKCSISNASDVQVSVDAVANLVSFRLQCSSSALNFVSAPTSVTALTPTTTPPPKLTSHFTEARLVEYQSSFVTFICALFVLGGRLLILYPVLVHSTLMNFLAALNLGLFLCLILPQLLRSLTGVAKH